ncbi:PREDICTED: LYR motif-containing protein 4 isoform X1 [Capra hircus]|uniref:LYR motif-containing protein 4 isoform X1 n=1 Tax=Capra hircus TaxID=9925 RepID=UPI000846C5A8|nr:PREDICTED: LYR motif-containing protein 4 isoform X1 [Capra hircus]
MAASSRAQVLDLYRAMLRESKRFGAYNYRSTHVLLLLSLTSGLPGTPQTALPSTTAPGDSKMRAWGSAKLSKAPTVSGSLTGLCRTQCRITLTN